MQQPSSSPLQSDQNNNAVRLVRILQVSPSPSPSVTASQSASPTPTWSLGASQSQTPSASSTPTIGTVVTVAGVLGHGFADGVGSVTEFFGLGDVALDAGGAVGVIVRGIGQDDGEGGGWAAGVFVFELCVALPKGPFTIVSVPPPRAPLPPRSTRTTRSSGASTSALAQ